MYSGEAEVEDKSDDPSLNVMVDFALAAGH